MYLIAPHAWCGKVATHDAHLHETRRHYCMARDNTGSHISCRVLLSRSMSYSSAIRRHDAVWFIWWWSGPSWWYEIRPDRTRLDAVHGTQWDKTTCTIVSHTPSDETTSHMRCHVVSSHHMPSVRTSCILVRLVLFAVVCYLVSCHPSRFVHCIVISCSSAR